MAKARKAKVSPTGGKDVPCGCSTGEPYRPPDRLTVSARKINNGWLISKSGYKDGKHFDDELFSQTKPTVTYGELKREARLTGKEI